MATKYSQMLKYRPFGFELVSESSIGSGSER
jgi:hypothetical protein